MIRGRLTYLHMTLAVAALVLIGYTDSGSDECEPYRFVTGMHRDIRIPNVTLTEDMMTDMSLDGLTIDTSVIDPAGIMRSIAPWEKYVERYAARYDVDPDLVRAIIYAESKGDPSVVSHVGAQGLMQLMPVTADFMGIEDPFDPEENIRAGVKYISWLVKYHSDQDEKSLLWAWNAGPGKYGKRIIPNETRKFIVEVLSVKSFLKEGRIEPI